MYGCLRFHEYACLTSCAANWLLLVAAVFSYIYIHIYIYIYIITCIFVYIYTMVLPCLMSRADVPPLLISAAFK